MTNPVGRAQVVQEFATEYGCTLPTAEYVVDLFLAVVAANDKEQAQREMDRIVRAGIEAGAVWAHDYIEGYMRTKLTQAPAIYAEAVARGGDPAAALQAVYALSGEAAAGLVAVLKSRAA